MLIAIVAALALIYVARDELLGAIGSVSMVFLALTFAATLAMNLVLWLVFHAGVEGGKDFLTTSKMYFGGQVAKYIPGKVWSVVYQATLRSASMPVGNIVQANLVIYALTILSAVFASLALILYPVSKLIAALLIVVGALLSAFFISSDHLYKILQRVSRFSKKVELTSIVPRTEFSMAVRVLVYGLVSSLYVLSNVFLLFVFYDFELADALRLTAYLGVSWVAGVVVAITPSGFGVREAVFVTIGTVGDPNNFELYASIAIIARVIQVGQDLISALLVPSVVAVVKIARSK